jgi:hypothetical protein
MYKIRFHLAKGKNYQKWQIKSSGGTKFYLPPSKCILKLNECKLINNKRVANKIFDGSNKSVCAWIEFKDYETLDVYEFADNLKQLRFNPRVLPHWFDVNKKDVDNKEYNNLLIFGKDVFEIVN